MATHLQLPAAGFGKRKSLADQLNHLDTLEDDDERAEQTFQTIEELEADVEAAKVFRWQAPRTQSRQDVHLAKYKQFVYSVVLNRKDWTDINESEWSVELFSSDLKKMSRYMCMFLVYAFKTTAPRAKASGTIQLSTLCQYRDSLLFWAGWYYGLREETLNRSKLFNDMVKQMRFAQDKYGDVYKKKTKSWLGLAEMRQLFDWETVNNRSIELSEQHQVLWAIGRVTALRPGSLCPASKYARTAPLKWKNFRFFKGTEKGQFTAVLEVEHIDIKRSNDPMKIVEAPVTTQPLRLRFTSPAAENLVFSPSHRLLVIALRRKLLQDINTLEDLFQYDKHEIFIKAKALDEVVFFRGNPKGDGIDHRSYLTSSAMTAYLQLRGYHIGYDQAITWYSIRRRAATDMVRRVGPATTRFLLGHSPDSHTLERYYLDLTATFDNVGVLLEQGVEQGGISESYAKNWADLSLNKLEGQSLDASRGRALTQLVRRLITADPDTPIAPEGSKEMRNYRRRVRRYAQNFLVTTQKEWQRQKMSKQDMDERIGRLHASEFAEEVLKRALEKISDLREGLHAGADPDPREDQQWGDPDSLFVTEVDNRHEPDLENIAASGIDPELFDADGTMEMRIDTDTNAQAEEQVHKADYHKLAMEAMILWLENPLAANIIWKNRPAEQKRCPLCVEDATVPEEMKNKQYNRPVKLDEHLQGQYHRPELRWLRTINMFYVDEAGTFSCSYCVQVGRDNIFRATDLGQVVDHVQDSNDLSSGLEHDQLKAADGWYEPDWEDPRSVGPSAATLHLYKQQGIKASRKHGFDTSPMQQQLVPELVASGAIMSGSRGPQQLSARLSAHVESRNVSTGLADPQGMVPAHLQGLITTGDKRAAIEHDIPDYLRDEVQTQPVDNRGIWKQTEED